MFLEHSIVELSLRVRIFNNLNKKINFGLLAPQTLKRVYSD